MLSRGGSTAAAAAADKVKRYISSLRVSRAGIRFPQVGGQRCGFVFG